MGKKIKLPFKMRIFKNKSTNPLLRITDSKCEGPFASLDILEKYSKFIKEIRAKYGNGYKLLFKEDNISEFSEAILIPKGAQYPLDFVDMMSHGIKGDVKRFDSSGGHFIGAGKLRILDLINVNEQNVIKAKIEIYDQRNEKWIPKKSITTIFPESWTLQKYVDESIYCMNNKIFLEGNKYSAKTTCGIDTVIVIDSQKLITFYPLF
jgi:Bacterial EndoU nuclease